MLQVTLPPTHLAERQYVIDVIFGEFWGLPFVTTVADVKHTSVTLLGSPGELRFADGLFSTPDEHWLTSRSLPQRPLAQWSPSAAGLLGEPVPLLYGEPSVEVTQASISFSADILGSVFFMLSRYEEAIPFPRDQRERFVAKVSVAGINGFLERALVDEYVEILWSAMENLWPRLRRKPRRYSVNISHDVDTPLSIVGRNPRQLCTSLAADLLHRKAPILFSHRLAAIPLCKLGYWSADVANVFGFLMSASERVGVQSTFNFFGGRTHPEDGDYDIAHPWFRALLRKIHARGHAIGLHTSYETLRDSEQTKREFARLRQVCEEEDIRQASWGGRQHFLRWSNPETWQNWESAGLDYDSTLGFADDAGFRVGTSFSFPVFNLQTKKKLKLREIPLIAMEGALLVSQGKTLEETMSRMTKLAAVCKKHGGTFAVLWHNTQLLDRRRQHAYRELLEQITR